MRRATRTLVLSGELSNQVCDYQEVPIESRQAHTSRILQVHLSLLNPPNVWTASCMKSRLTFDSQRVSVLFCSDCDVVDAKRVSDPQQLQLPTEAPPRVVSTELQDKSVTEKSGESQGKS